MWEVLEHASVAKTLAKAPPQVRANYDVWVSIARQQGPQGLRAVKGFHDEALSGQLEGTRTSRLSGKWRVYYQRDKDAFRIYVDRVDAHRYRKSR